MAHHLFELTASVVLWRGDEILVMKRATGFSAGGWFLPGGHLEQGERPAEACVRELREETGIVVTAESLALVAAMTYEGDGGTAHSFIFAADCPPAAEPVIDAEHIYFRWMTPDAYIARFLDAAMLRERGVGPAGMALAAEVARVVRAAERAR